MSFKKLKIEFERDYLGSYDEKNNTIILVNTPAKEYKDIYLRIRKVSDTCTVSVIRFNGKVKDLLISNINE